MLVSGKPVAPDIAAGADGTLDLALPADWRSADALSLVASDSGGQELWTWTWLTLSLGKRLMEDVEIRGETSAEKSDELISLKAGEVTAGFDAQTGMLVSLRRGDQVLTQGGIIGKVTKVGDDGVLEVEIADGVKVKILDRKSTRLNSSHT